MTTKTVTNQEITWLLTTTTHYTFIVIFYSLFAVRVAEISQINVKRDSNIFISVQFFNLLIYLCLLHKIAEISDILCFLLSLGDVLYINILVLAFHFFLEMATG